MAITLNREAQGPSSIIDRPATAARARTRHASIQASDVIFTFGKGGGDSHSSGGDRGILGKHISDEHNAVKDGRTIHLGPRTDTKQEDYQQTGGNVDGTGTRGDSIPELGGDY